jgi:hypothetical protein
VRRGAEAIRLVWDRSPDRHTLRSPKQPTCGENGPILALENPAPFAKIEIAGSSHHNAGLVVPSGHSVG